ncbi:hypothetical protein BDY24DRAFT_411437 [Mrakia frigida]|uniref:uncharacterized protein n=1 Tax=Mrakia frigida TaxID=29902 RepID=UPI003FCBF046
MVNADNASSEAGVVALHGVLCRVWTPGSSGVADLWHAPKDKKSIGNATTGSSEAIHLGGLAMKKRWQAKMKALGKISFSP